MTATAKIIPMMRPLFGPEAKRRKPKATTAELWEDFKSRNPDLLVRMLEITDTLASRNVRRISSKLVVEACRVESALAGKPRRISNSLTREIGLWLREQRPHLADRITTRTSKDEERGT
jgi:hypothetical protein